MCFGGIGLLIGIFPCTKLHEHCIQQALKYQKSNSIFSPCFLTENIDWMLKKRSQRKEDQQVEEEVVLHVGWWGVELWATPGEEECVVEWGLDPREAAWGVGVGWGHPGDENSP